MRTPQPYSIEKRVAKSGHISYRTHIQPLVLGKQRKGAFCFRGKRAVFQIFRKHGPQLVLCLLMGMVLRNDGFHPFEKTQHNGYGLCFGRM